MLAILGGSQMVTQYLLSPAVIEADQQATGRVRDLPAVMFRNSAAVA